MGKAKHTSGRNEAAAGKAPWERKDPDPAKGIRTDPGQRALMAELDAELKQTFPASDATTVTGGTDGVGKPRKPRKAS